jgi:hypothetical protein
MDGVGFFFGGSLSDAHIIIIGVGGFVFSFFFSLCFARDYGLDIWINRNMGFT